MKTKSFDSYLKERLSEKEIRDIKKAASLELDVFKALQQEVAKNLKQQMGKNGLHKRPHLRRNTSTPES